MIFNCSIFPSFIPTNQENWPNVFPYKALYWANVLAIVPMLGQFFWFVGIPSKLPVHRSCVRRKEMCESHIAHYIIEVRYARSIAYLAASLYSFSARTHSFGGCVFHVIFCGVFKSHISHYMSHSRDIWTLTNRSKSYRRNVAGVELQVTSCRYSITGIQLQVHSCRCSITGVWL